MSSNLVEYNVVKDMKVVDILGYLDIVDKQQRIEKIKEYTDKEKGWLNAFKQKRPK